MIRKHVENTCFFLFMLSICVKMNTKKKTQEKKEESLC